LTGGAAVPESFPHGGSNEGGAAVPESSAQEDSNEGGATGQIVLQFGEPIPEGRELVGDIKVEAIPGAEAGAEKGSDHDHISVTEQRIDWHDAEENIRKEYEETLNLKSLRLKLSKRSKTGFTQQKVSETPEKPAETSSYQAASAAEKGTETQEQKIKREYEEKVKRLTEEIKKRELEIMKQELEDLRRSNLQREIALNKHSGKDSASSVKEAGNSPDPGDGEIRKVRRVGSPSTQRIDIDHPVSRSSSSKDKGGDEDRSGARKRRRSSSRDRTKDHTVGEKDRTARAVGDTYGSRQGSRTEGAQGSSKDRVRNERERAFSKPVSGSKDDRDSRGTHEGSRAREDDQMVIKQEATNRSQRVERERPSRLSDTRVWSNSMNRDSRDQAVVKQERDVSHRSSSRPEERERSSRDRRDLSRDVSRSTDIHAEESSERYHKQSLDPYASSVSTNRRSSRDETHSRRPRSSSRGRTVKYRRVDEQDEYTETRRSTRRESDERTQSSRTERESVSVRYQRGNESVSFHVERESSTRRHRESSRHERPLEGDKRASDYEDRVSYRTHDQYEGSLRATEENLFNSQQRSRGELEIDKHQPAVCYSDRPTLCAFFMRGHCKFGVGCKFSHDQPGKLASSSREDWDLLRGDGDSFRADRDSIRGGRDSFRETRDSFREERGTRVPFGRGGRINPSRTREQNQQDLDAEYAARMARVKRAEDKLWEQEQALKAMERPDDIYDSRGDLRNQIPHKPFWAK